MAELSETERFYPFSEGPGEFVTEDDWAVMASGFQDDGVYGHPGTPALTVAPGPESGTIQVNVGDAQVAGYHYRLTAPKLINTVANAGTVDRWDAVVLQLDREARTITPVILPGTSIGDIGPDRAPLGLWKQPPAAAVTADYWGEAQDARWFIGSRVRPFLPSAIPPAVPGAIIHDPNVEGTGSVYLGKLDKSGHPYWAQWYPIASERMDPFEIISRTNLETRSTNWQIGSVEVSRSFVAPPSGQIMVTVFAQLECTSPASAFCSFEIRRNNASGTVIQAPSNEYAASNQDRFWSGSTRRKLVTGLTPGDTYFVRLLHRTDVSGATATVFFRSLIVEPVYTQVAPGLPPEGGLGVDPSTVVLTSGGSTIRIPDGNTTTQALAVRLPAGDRATAPDSLAFYVNTGTDVEPVWSRTGYFNEYGELRVIPSSTSRVAARLRMNPGQTADAFQVADLNNVPRAGFRANGEIYAPNIGNAKVSAGTEPTNPAVGDLWVDLTQNPPVLNVRGIGGWSPLTGGGVNPDDPTAAPSFVDAQQTYANDLAVNLALPMGDTYLACLTWNTTDAITVPSGWKLVQSGGGSGSRTAVYTASAGVGTATFSFPTTNKVSAVVLGYTSAVVLTSDQISNDTSGVLEAPALNVTSAPAVLTRFYWGKASTITSMTPNDTSATQRGVQYGTGPGSCAVLATDQVVPTAQTVASATATADIALGDAGGFSIALVDPSLAEFQFSTDFEDGTLAGLANVTSATTVDAAAAYSGSFGMKQAATHPAAGIASLADASLPDGYEWADVSFRFKQVNNVDGNSPIVTVQNRTGADHAELFVNYAVDSRLWWDITPADSAQADITPGQWYDIRVVVGYGSTDWVMRVWIDGVERPMVTSTGKPISDVRTIHFGGFAPETNTRYYDNIQVTLSHVDPVV